MSTKEPLKLGYTQKNKSLPSNIFEVRLFHDSTFPNKTVSERHKLPWEPTTFIFRGYNPYIGGVKPSFFSKGSWWFQPSSFFFSALPLNTLWLLKMYVYVKKPEEFSPMQSLPCQGTIGGSASGKTSKSNGARQRISVSLITSVLMCFFVWKTQRIHVWYIYVHLVDFYGKCRYIHHTWILWERWGFGDDYGDNDG